MFLPTNSLSLLYRLFPENISLFPLISWFVLYLISQAFTNQNATHNLFRLSLVSLHINYIRLFNAKSCLYIFIKSLWFINTFHILCFGRCPWCNGYRRRKWTRRHEFKSWTRLIIFHIALIHLLFSFQLWVNSRADWVLQPWWGK